MDILVFVLLMLLRIWGPIYLSMIFSLLNLRFSIHGQSRTQQIEMISRPLHFVHKVMNAFLCTDR